MLFLLCLGSDNGFEQNARTCQAYVCNLTGGLIKLEQWPSFVRSGRRCQGCFGNPTRGLMKLEELSNFARID